MADYTYITLNGVIVPNPENVPTEVQSEWKGVFGEDLNTNYNTPQGVQIAQDVITRQFVLRNNAALANQINPNQATGVYLYALCALSGIVPLVATPSTAIVNLTGAPTAIIPINTQIQCTLNNSIWITLSAVTLAIDGTASVGVQCLTPGPIPAPIGTLTQIVANTAPPGLETVTNPEAAIIGVQGQTDSALRAYRNLTLGAQGSGLAASLKAAVTAVPGVTSSQILENTSWFTVIEQGITLTPKSFWMGVAGGSDLAVATALASVKDGGCGYNGAVMVNITDPSSNQTQVVRFDRPIIVPVTAIITAHADTGIVNPTQSITQAVLNYAAGIVPGLPGFVVGASVSPFEISAAIVAQYPGIYVQNVQVSKLVPLNYQPTEIPLLISQQATILESSITVVLY